MLLAIDVGNTQTSFGVYQGEARLYHWRAETNPTRTVDEYASLLFPWFQHYHLNGTQWAGAALCSVVPSVDSTLEEFCRQYLSTSLFRIHSGLNFGCRIHLHVPSEVGTDRLVNASYAVRKMKLPSVVVDFGSATTFDVVSSAAVYEGGVILPGVRMGLQALGEKTAKLPIVDARFPRSVIGKNTVEAIQSGMLHGYSELVDGLLVRIEKEIGEPCEVALTGGLATLFHNRLRHSCLHLPDLTLDGIALLFKENT